MTAADADQHTDPHAHDVAVAARVGSWFRGDIDGLRAIAIVLVVAYHANLPALDGGFVGVDVFFVISGFLISRNLLRETETTDRVHLGEFWARRLRRLVPALALVVATTLAVGSVVLPLYQRDELATQGAAATLYVSNIYFANQAQDYFAADIAGSPLLHTWSLGVEEQFYLVWPLIFAAVAWLATRRATPSPRGLARRRRVLVAVFSVTLVVSFGWNLVLTDDRSPWAFFGLPTRAWEFAVAGLLAAVTVPAFLRPVAARTAAAVVGLGLVAWATLTYDDLTPYPGWHAAVPVVGTALLILAGERWGGEEDATPVSRLLTLPPAQWLGRVSYSWYLWHWPFIVLTVAWLDDDARTVTTAAALASLPVAAVAYRWFETPLRFAAPIARSLPRTFAFAAAVTVAVLLGTTVVRPDVPEVAAVGSTLDPAALEAPPGSSIEERVAVAVAQYEARTDTSCPHHDAVATPRGDYYCVGGDTTSDTTVMLIGDSHAGGWRRALEAAAADRGVRLVTRQHNGCSPWVVRTEDPNREDKNPICTEQRAGDLRVIEDLRPDAIIVSAWSGATDRVRFPDGSDPTPTEAVQVWADAAAERTAAYEDLGAAVGLIVDVPTLPFDPSACIAREDDIAACEPTRDEALAPAGRVLAAERRLAEERGYATLDGTDLICDESTCRLEIDGSLVYVDEHHVTDAFAARQVDRLGALIDQVLAERGS